jgi:hypothetical protein
VIDINDHQKLSQLIKNENKKQNDSYLLGILSTVNLVRNKISDNQSINQIENFLDLLEERIFSEKNKFFN